MFIDVIKKGRGEEEWRGERETHTDMREKH